MPVNDQTPDVLPVDADGAPMPVADGAPIPIGTAGLLAIGTDLAGNARRLLVDASGALEIGAVPPPSGASLLRFNSGAFAASGVLSVVAATLRDLTFTYKGNSTGRWLHLFNAIAVPANGAVPFVLPIPLSKGNSTRFVGSYTPEMGDRFTVGIVFALSSTESTFTLDATTDLWVTAQHTAS